MKLIPLLLAVCALVFATTAHAQWQSTTYSIRGGWSSIYLSGDAKQDTLDNIFPASVTQVWRWNPNATQVQFTESPLVPSAGTPEWSVWKRGLPLESNLSQLTGGSAYLVKSAGGSDNTYSVTIKQSPVPPAVSWVRNGANLMGFPTFKTGANYPTIASYFSTFPAAIAANAKIFKYNGGELGPNNPIQVFSTTSERLDRTQAYWFSAEVVENFYAPLELSVSNTNGLDFGRTGSTVTVRVHNRSNAVASVNVSGVNSETSPAGQTAVTGPVPLTRRVFNPTTLVWTETPITAAFSQAIGPQSTVELEFGINRAAMGGDADALYASFLRITDSGNLMDVVLPARARKASLTGLWVGDISLTGVDSKVAGSVGSSTPTTFPLRTLLHVSENGSANLLSQVFIGQLAALPNDNGICTREALLKQDAKADARRLVAAHMPLDRVIAGAGSVEVPGTLKCTVAVPFNDPTNPFVHQYHPDHDNKNARQQPVGAGDESYDIVRVCTFTFTASPPPGSTTTTSGWGSSVLGGIYTETISGLHKEPITLSGTFELNRASEIGTLSQ
ncbi:MAG: hypothetical protein JWO82_2972 [Akkermansiaceae bacterium]|nr:hypothetical protein [Akkermansiaceae bacterium]